MSARAVSHYPERRINRSRTFTPNDKNFQKASFSTLQHRTSPPFFSKFPSRFDNHLSTMTLDRNFDYRKYRRDGCLDCYRYLDDDSVDRWAFRFLLLF
uniref:Uncharacterized protein n=1 Tax=Syphacia muris TaxID=451379 RepID=A0A0N5ADN9_9BILA